ncbi:MAG TPA: chromate transporter, partial [Candidatus Binatia bacterium]
AAVFPLVGMIRRSHWASGFLDGVNVGALGLIAGVTWQLGRAALTDWFTIVVAVLALVLILRFKTNSAWLVLGGGAAGLIFKLLFLT